MTVGPDASNPPVERFYADVPSRAAALAVDAVLLTLIIFLAAVVVSVLIGPAVELDSAADSLDDAVTVDREVALVDAAASLMLSAAYFILSWVRAGGTPGQRLLAMRVGREADGRPLSPAPASVRWALVAAPFGLLALLRTAAEGLDDTIPDLAVATWYGVLLVSIALSPRKQGLHDRLVGSAVAKRGRRVGSRWQGHDDR